MSDQERDVGGAARFEEELRAALGRVDAPEGFAGRVLARVEERRGDRAGRAGWWRAVAAAAAFLLGALSGGWLMHQERVDRRQAMETEQQFRVAMQMTARVTERSFAEAGRRMRGSDDGEVQHEREAGGHGAGEHRAGQQAKDGGKADEGATR